MKIPVKAPPQIGHKCFHIRDMNKPEYRHIWFLLFWPIFGIRYLILERIDPLSPFHLIHSPLDDIIPFQEWFLIPYVLWYVLLFGMHLYTMVYDVDAFRKYSKFLIISMTTSTAIFILYPSYQNLRPVEFPRDNVLTGIVRILYRLDTNTNVFPSEHAIGAIAVFAAYLHMKKVHSPMKTAVFTIITILICLSTVFLKQHSVLDVLAALPICAVSYWICYPALCLPSQSCCGKRRHQGAEKGIFSGQHRCRGLRPRRKRGQPAQPHQADAVRCAEKYCRSGG